MLLLYVLLSSLGLLSQRICAQTNGARYRVYDLNMQRFKVKFISSFAYGVHQGQIDEDSAAVLTCNGEHLPHRYFYDEVYDMTGTAPGHELIDQRRISDAVAMVPQLTGAQQIQLLLQLASYYLYRPGNAASDLDSAWAFSQAAVKFSEARQLPQWKLACYKVIGKLYFQKGDTITSNRYLEAMLQMARKTGQPFEIAQALGAKAAATPTLNPVRVRDLQEACTIYWRLKDTTHAILAENSIFDVYFVRGKIDTVAQELKRMTDLENAIGFRETHYNYTVISFIDQLMNRYPSALENSLKAVKIMEATRDTLFSPFVYSKMGDLFAYYEDLSEILLWYDKALANKKTTEDYMWYSVTLAKINTFLSFRHPAEAEALITRTLKERAPGTPLEGLKIYIFQAQANTKLGQYKAAQLALEKAYAYLVQVRHQPETAVFRSVYFTSAAELKIKQGNYVGAQAAIDSSRQIMAGLDGSPVLEMRNLEVASGIDSANGDMAGALEKFKRYRVYERSLDHIREARQLEEFRIKFDLTQKEKDLQLLQNKNQLQQDQLHREALTRNMIIGGLVMLSLLLALLYNRFRLKQKQQIEINGKNKALEKLVHEKDNLITEKDNLINEKDNLITEKEWLIKEIHHRVKNNLQMVVSLLSAQSAHLNSKEAVYAIRESEQRMHAMSLIHQKLYQTEKMELIEMSAYIKELAGYLNAHSGAGARIRFALNLQQANLDVVQAVPLGLILNEAITNALKYAFPGHNAGVITISLRHAAPYLLELKISDNGQGLPADFDLTRTKSLGITLMKGLSQQLKGSLTVENEQGVAVTIHFPYSLFAVMETEANATTAATA